MTRGSRMHRSRKRSLALAVAVALAVYAPEIFAAAPSHAVPDFRLNNAAEPPPDRANLWVPIATADLGLCGRWLDSRGWADDFTSCILAVGAATPQSASTALCFDDGEVPLHDLSGSPPLARTTGPDVARPTISPTWTHAVASSAPVVSTETSSSAQPDLRPDNPPVPPLFLLNIWAPVSANAPGGSGTWSLTSNTWTDINGDAPAVMSPQPGFAIFQGTPGMVTVDDSAGTLSATGLRFAIDGYTLAGDALQLAGNAGSLVSVDVGDGTSASAVDGAVIRNVLTGSAGLNKVDFGTLTLAGTNTYTGETDINGGTLALAGNGSIADSSGVVIFGSSTLDISGTVNGAAIKNLENDGSTDGSVVLGGKTLTISNAYGDGFTGTISGSGGLTIWEAGSLYGAQRTRV